MAHYLLRRFCSMFFILLCVSIITFSLMHFVPGDPAKLIAEKKYGDNVTAEAVELVRSEMGLDRPVFIQYFNWMAGILRGDFGTSSGTGRPVWDEITSKLPATVELALAAMLVSLIIAIPVGILSAVKQYSIMDSACMLGAMLGVSMPNFWLGLLLILVFSVNLGWFPVYGRGDLTQLILPALTLGTGIAAVTARLTRSSILEILNRIISEQRGPRTGRKSRYQQARSKKCTHSCGYGCGPADWLSPGAVVVEVIFAWPGLGRLLYDSIFARDFSVIQGCVFS